MLVYLHGFNSSPASHKAQLMRSYMEGRGLGSRYACPALPDTPRAAIGAIEIAIAGCAARTLTFIGSSLGGFYATHLAEKLGCRPAAPYHHISRSANIASMFSERSLRRWASMT